ncbi:hypothetical protein P2H44_25360 [Albimonas sp. CAU 1670]|uniref:hypothetical protein n=1 Tax=Albimonas sp. CAU 1670 TaxID=3032599 RepID=UPI0023DAE4AD|nr:hypothetical protein [Albimonas sp. CAU 1670]MDF2235893.1 hypothetical protein [Albimonas sp. CAU 1670]
MKIITTAQQALDNIERLEDGLAQSPELADRFGFARAWYVDTRDPARPRFGFSKFIGYENMDVATYLESSQELDGRNTEWFLKEFFEELRSGTPEFNHYHDKLAGWLGDFGKAPRKTIRLMVLKPEFRTEVVEEDRRLLELLAAVADLLPLDQRHELRARL